jgi:hypothetical protein
VRSKHSELKKWMNVSHYYNLICFTINPFTKVNGLRVKNKDLDDNCFRTNLIMRAIGKMIFLKAMAEKYIIRASIMKGSGRMEKNKAMDTTRLMRALLLMGSGNRISHMEWARNRGRMQLCSRAITVTVRRKAAENSNGKTVLSTKGSF